MISWTRRRTATALAPLLAATALAALTAPPSAAAATCQGQQATIVGTPNQELLSGTPGADVIVTNGALATEAGEGDDTICSTRDLFYRVDAGPGEDSVLVTDGYVGVDGGAGDDVIRLGSAHDSVTAFSSGGTDQVIGTAGYDRVTLSTSPDGDGRFVADLGAGADGVTIYGTPLQVELHLGPGLDHLTEYAVTTTPDSVIDGGADGASLEIRRPDAPGDHVIDLVAQQFTTNGERAFGWTGITAVQAFLPAGSGTVRGSTGNDDVAVSGLRAASMGGGNDALAMSPPYPDDLEVYGGTGTDRFVISMEDEQRHDVTFDLPHAEARITTRSAEPQRFRVGLHGMEGYVGDAYGVVRMIGTSGRDQLDAAGCTNVVNGYGGNDLISTYRPRDDHQLEDDCEHVMDGSWPDDRVYAGGGDDVVVYDRDVSLAGSRGTIERFKPVNYYGQQGDDVLIGSRMGDVLLGGPGRDRADGRGNLEGRDRCVAEREARCER